MDGDGLIDIAERERHMAHVRYRSGQVGQSPANKWMVGAKTPATDLQRTFVKHASFCELSTRCNNSGIGIKPVCDERVIRPESLRPDLDRAPVKPVRFGEVANLAR